MCFLKYVFTPKMCFLNSENVFFHSENVFFKCSQSLDFTGFLLCKRINDINDIYFIYLYLFQKFTHQYAHYINMFYSENVFAYNLQNKNSHKYTHDRLLFHYRPNRGYLLTFPQTIYGLFLKSKYQLYTIKIPIVLVFKAFFDT